MTTLPNGKYNQNPKAEFTIFIANANIATMRHFPLSHSPTKQI